MNDCDNFAELFSCARLAYQAGDYDEEKNAPERSTKKLIADGITQGFQYRKGHADFLRHAYRMGRFNRRMQNGEEA
jgi:hypothetical protein